MGKKWNEKSAILAVTTLFEIGLLCGCGFNTISGSNGDTNMVSSIQKKSCSTSSAVSNTAASADVGQDNEAGTFSRIEPTILERTQNATYNYLKGKLSFTIETNTSNFPSEYVSTIFNPHVDFMLSSIFISTKKIAVIRTPDDDSIVITYSNDDGKTWHNSDAIHTEQIPDHATAESVFLGKNKVNHLLSLYVDFPSKQTGFLIIGSVTTMGTQYTKALFKTTDGGKTWFSLNSNIGLIHGFPITGMRFIDGKNGFIVQSGLNVNKADVCKTVNGGVTWSTNELPVPSALVNDPYASLTALAPYDVSSQWFLPIVIRPDKMIYFKSEDQGKSWSYDSSMDTKTNQFLSSIAS